MTSLQKWTTTAAIPYTVLTFLTSLRYYTSYAHPDYTEYDDNDDGHDHTEDPMLSTGQVVGIVCGVLVGIIVLTIVSLLLLRAFDPIAWNRLLMCLRSLSSCTVALPEQPDEPVKSRDPEDPLEQSDEIEVKLREKERKVNFIEDYQPVAADAPGQDVVDIKENVNFRSS